ncbi:hypothetical protein [Verrucomicrobium spinosum]|uniref:hypothetical protein n=1 Tax=Verrucomicrobium spinosum TaxID=2736 RepID=UPI0012E10A7A|nr:hypothetical protein [Verrucomicrobium spinosum]
MITRPPGRRSWSGPEFGSLDRQLYRGAVMLPGAMILVSPAPDCDVSKLLRMATRAVKDAGVKLTKICVVFFQPADSDLQIID